MVGPSWARVSLMARFGAPRRTPGHVPDRERVLPHGYGHPNVKDEMRARMRPGRTGTSRTPATAPEPGPFPDSGSYERYEHIAITNADSYDWGIELGYSRDDTDPSFDRVHTWTNDYHESIRWTMFRYDSETGELTSQSASNWVGAGASWSGYDTTATAYIYRISVYPISSAGEGEQYWGDPKPWP